MVSRRPLSSALRIPAPTPSRSNVVKSRILSFVGEACLALSSSVRRRFEMLPQEIASEVAVEITPHRVDVVPVVLRVVELDEERRALHAVVVLLTALDRSGPREGDVLDPGFLDLGQPIG